MSGKFSRQGSNLKPDLAAILLLALLVVIAFANVVFGGKSLVPSENMNPLDFRATARNYGPDFVPHETWTRQNLVINPNYRDPIASTLQMEPAQELLRQGLGQAEFPFWDPYIGGGTPSFATMIPAYLFPPSLAVVLMGNGSLVKNIYILLLILTSGVLTYFLLRRHQLSWLASLAGAVAFAFSGAVIQTTPLSLGQPVAFFSLPLLVTARLFDRPGARRAAELALAFAFVALASFPPILAEIFATCVVYFVVALVLRPRSQRSQPAGWFAAGTVTAMAIAGIIYIPALPVMAAATHVSAYYARAATGILEARQVMQLLSPKMMGGAAVYINPALMGQTGGMLYYTGAIALFLSGIGFVARVDGTGSRTLKITAIVAGGLAAAKIFGLPPVHWVIYLPILRNVHYSSYFGIAVAYTVALLAALGVDSLVKGRARSWQLAASGVILATALVLLRWNAGRNEVGLHPEGWYWIAAFRVIVIFAILGVAFAFVARRSRFAHLGAALVITVLMAEGITNSVYPRQQRWNVWSHPPRYVEILAERNTGNRVHPMPHFAANTEQVYRQPTLDSLTLNTSPRMYEFYRRYFSADIGNFLQSTQRLPPERILDIANIEYFAFSTPDDVNLQEARNRDYETLFVDDLVTLERRPTMPRYSLTSNYRVAETEQAALEALPALAAGGVVLEQQPTFASSPTSPASKVSLAHFSLNEVDLVVEAPAANILVCSESNMSGWTATVDGREVPILAANYAFRAIEVPAGSHAIRFHYRPPGLYLGLSVTVLGLMSCFWGLSRRAAIPTAAEL